MYLYVDYYLLSYTHMKPKHRYILFIIGLATGIVLSITYLTDSTILTGIAADISDPTGIQYLAYLPIVFVLVFIIFFTLFLTIGPILPPLTINIRHRRNHPNTSSGLIEFLMSRNTDAKKYHDRLLSESQTTLSEEEQQ